MTGKSPSNMRRNSRINIAKPPNAISTRIKTAWARRLTGALTSSGFVESLVPSFPKAIVTADCQTRSSTPASAITALGRPSDMLPITEEDTAALPATPTTEPAPRHATALA
eukprot:6175376-Pleurochrysis_carterae.AAC.5